MNLDTMIDTVRAGMADSATADQRQAAAHVCRQLATVLEATPGQPLGVSSSAPGVSSSAGDAAPPSTATAATTPGGNVLQRIEWLLGPAGAPVLDGLIARLRGELEERDGKAGELEAPEGFEVPFVHVS